MGVMRALSRARLAIGSVGLTYLATVLIGIIMVHSGSQFAISYRDKIVSGAQASPTLKALERNDHLQAALLDFGGNLFGAFSTSVTGLGVIMPYPLIAYRGWIGGIVSIDGSHVSRLADPSAAVYYVVTLVMQLIPYTLTGGAGVNLGLALWRPRAYYQGNKWLGMPKEAVRDALRIYAVAVPLFLLASVWEFFMA